MRPGPRAAQAIRPPRHSLALGRLHDRVRPLMGPAANEPFCSKGPGPVPPAVVGASSLSPAQGSEGYASAPLSESARRYTSQKPDVCVSVCYSAEQWLSPRPLVS